MAKDSKGGDDILGRILKNADRKKAKEAAKAFQGGAWRGMKQEGESATAGWVQKLVNPVNVTQDPFMAALRSVMRAANVLSNAEEGDEEKFLQVAWSSGSEQNDVKSNMVFLSPDVISRETTLKPEWNIDERVDVLTGDALTLSSIKRLATQAAINKVKGNETAENLWYCLETLNAENDVLTDFPGFGNYFASVRSYYCDKDAKGMLEGRIGMADAIGIPDLEGALTAVKWEKMYPDQILNLPPLYRDAVDHCKSVLSDDLEKSTERADAALDVSEYLTKLFPPPPSSGGSGGKKNDKNDKKDQNQQGSGSGGSSQGDSDDQDQNDDQDDKQDGQGDGESKGDNDNKDNDEGEGDDDKQDKKNDKDNEGNDDNKQDEQGKGKDGKDKKNDGKDKEPQQPKNGDGKDNQQQKEQPQKPKQKLPNIGQARAKLGDNVKNQSNKKIAGRSIASSDVEKPKDEQFEVCPPNENTWVGGTTETMMDGDAAAYKQMVNALKGRISALKNHIKLQAEQVTFFHHGLKSGQLDDGSLYKIGVDRREDCLFEQKEIKAKPKIVIGILADESGSMSSNRRYLMVRELTVLLANAFKDFDGLELCVMGHTTQGWGGRGEQLWLRHYYTPKNKKLEALSGITAYGNNLDGYAMYEMARRMMIWYPEIENRHMIVISDGQPNGEGYGWHSAMDHMREVVGKAKMWGVNIFGCAVDNAYNWETGERMYGPNNFVILPDAYSAIPTLGKYITKIIKKANVLR